LRGAKQNRDVGGEISGGRCHASDENRVTSGTIFEPSDILRLGRCIRSVWTPPPATEPYSKGEAMNRKTAAAARLGVIGALSALSSAARAHCPDYWYEIVATAGDVVPGVGAITGFGKAAVNTRGEWRVEAFTDHPDPAASIVVLGTSPLLRQGQSLVEPPGATL